MADLESKITEIKQKIEVELKCKEGAEHMLNRLVDPSAVEQCEMKIIETCKRLEYLERELRNMELKKLLKSPHPTKSHPSHFQLPPPPSKQPPPELTSPPPPSKQPPPELTSSVVPPEYPISGPSSQPLLSAIDPITPLISPNTFSELTQAVRQEHASIRPPPLTPEQSPVLDSPANRQAKPLPDIPGGVVLPPSAGVEPSRSASTHILSSDAPPFSVPFDAIKRNSAPDIYPNVNNIQDADMERSIDSHTPTRRTTHHTAPLNQSLNRMSMQDPGNPSAQRTSVFESILNTLGVRGRSSTMSGVRSMNSSQSSLNHSAHSDLFASKAAYTQFDFNLQETMISSEKVKYKLSEIRHKLDVEQKVKSGTEKMMQAMTLSSSGGKLAAEVEEKMRECDAKVGLLLKAEMKYKGLYFEEEEEEQQGNANDKLGGEIVKPSTLIHPVRNIRRPFTGKVLLRIGNANNLSGKKSSKTESWVVVKVDGTVKATTRASKGGKWNEDFTLLVEKASEVELSVYEKGGYILGLAWFKLWELEDAITARTKVMEQSIEPKSPTMNSSSASNDSPLKASFNFEKNNAAFAGHVSQEGFESALELEPSGKLGIRMKLVAEARVSKVKDGVMRRQNVKKVFPKRGHKFAPQQFYQVIKCASCGDFLMSGQGFRLCQYTCHKKCSERVMIKCITKLDEKEEDQMQLLKHKIPHRFEPAYNLSPNWCCHCGQMLPLGKKQSFKCTECSTMAHRECAHLVPNFCGLKSEMIEQMLALISSAERMKKEKQLVQNQDKSARISEAAALFENTDQRRLSDAARASASNVSLSTDVNKTIIKGDATLPMSSSKSNLSGRMSRQNSLPTAALSSKPSKGVGLNDFNFLAVLGKGNFGKVMLAEEKTTRNLYAIKVLKKDFIIENDEVESTRSEKRVFLIANRERFPFLVNMHSCFQTESRIYFVMEYVCGGDLMWHIQHEQFTEQRAKYYACQVLLALEYFHKNDVVYRQVANMNAYSSDLKLDNILLTMDGHIKIADYGLCKENMGFNATTHTFCGTPEFMAPEILQEKPYGRAVDWWALGVLIYEMLLGQSPFRGEDEDEIFEAILNDDILYPVNMAKDAVSLLQKLLTKDPQKRLGAGKTDAEEIKRHAYFKDVNWDDVLHKKNPPPFIPHISSPTDVSNFDSEFTKEMPVLTPCHSVLSAADQEEFRGFTHISEWAQVERSKVQL